VLEQLGVVLAFVGHAAYGFSQRIIASRLHEDHPPRLEYFLTDKGKALGPVIQALHRWGEEFAETPKPTRARRCAW